MINKKINATNAQMLWNVDKSVISQSVEWSNSISTLKFFFIEIHVRYQDTRHSQLRYWLWLTESPVYMLLLLRYSKNYLCEIHWCTMTSTYWTMHLPQSRVICKQILFYNNRIHNNRIYNICIFKKFPLLSH